MTRFLPAVLPVALLLTLTLAQPVASRSRETLTCQKQSARRLFGFVKTVGACLAECHARANAGASRLCRSDTPDEALRRCLDRARRKARGGIRRACTGTACPACYAGGDCSAFVERELDAALARASLYADLFHCDDGGSPDGLTDRERRCRGGLWEESVRYAQRWVACQKAPAAGDCIEHAELRWSAACARCRDLPDCLPDIGDPCLLVESFGVSLEEFADTVFCEDSCGNGVLDAGETCDPRASPTGCPAGVSCTPSCRCPSVCGDGVVAPTEQCDASAPANGGCPDGLACIACLLCAARCGDGQVAGGETCELPSLGCPAGEECVRCLGCGRPVPAISATEDVPCAEGAGDRWTFAVEAGTIVRVVADTVDAATAAVMGIQADCGPAPLHPFRSTYGFPCTFTPPNDPGWGGGCPEWTFVAPVDGTCALTIGARPTLDSGTGQGCSDPAVARYRLTVTGTGLVLTGDDVPPGLAD